MQSLSLPEHHAGARNVEKSAFGVVRSRFSRSLRPVSMEIFQQTMTLAGVRWVLPVGFDRGSPGADGYSAWAYAKAASCSHKLVAGGEVYSEGGEKVRMQGHVLRRLAPDRQRIVCLYREGASLEEIAVLLDCAPSTIRRFLISLDIPLRAPLPRSKLDHVGGEVLAAFEKGDAIAEIARCFGVQTSTVARYLLINCGGSPNVRVE